MGGGITGGLTGIVSRRVLYFSPIKTGDWGEGASREPGPPTLRPGVPVFPVKESGVGGTRAKLVS